MVVSLVDYLKDALPPRLQITPSNLLEPRVRSSPADTCSRKNINKKTNMRSLQWSSRREGKVSFIFIFSVFCFYVFRSQWPSRREEKVATANCITATLVYCSTITTLVLQSPLVCVASAQL